MRRSHPIAAVCVLLDQGDDLELALVPYEVDLQHDARLEKRLLNSPQERLQAMLKARAGA